jgi:hypothetical protein
VFDYDKKGSEERVKQTNNAVKLPSLYLYCTITTDRSVICHEA